MADDRVNDGPGGSETDDFKTSDEIKPDGKVTRVGGKKLDDFAKAPIRKGK